MNIHELNEERIERITRYIKWNEAIDKAIEALKEESKE